MVKFFRFTFEDGHVCVCRGMSKQELKMKVLKHGKLMSKVLDCVCK